MQGEHGKARKIPRAHIEEIGRKARIGARDVKTVARAEILHPNGLRNLPVERVEDLLARRSFIDVAEGIEVPVVVVPEGAWNMGAPRQGPDYDRGLRCKSMPPNPCSRRVQTGRDSSLMTHPPLVSCDTCGVLVQAQRTPLNAQRTNYATHPATTQRTAMTPRNEGP